MESSLILLETIAIYFCLIVNSLVADESFPFHLAIKIGKKGMGGGGKCDKVMENLLVGKN